MSHYPRNRLRYALLGILVIALGLGLRSRLFPQGFFSKYAGDALWAVVVFLMFAWIFRSRPTWTVAVMAALFSIAIEVSQLSHEPWLVRLRGYKLGMLVLGNHFAFGDIAAYLVGIALAAVIERKLRDTSAART